MSQNQKALTELSKEELELKKQEIQFIGTQYAMNGCECPEHLTHDFEAIEQELATRARAPGR